MPRPDAFVAAPIVAGGIVLLVVCLLIVAQPPAGDMSRYILPPPCPFSTLAQPTHQYVPTPRGATPDGWYNFTVGCAATGIRWNDVTFQVATGSGYLESMATNTSLSVLSAQHQLVATFVPTGNNWTSTSAAGIVTNQSVSVYTEYSLDTGALWETTCYPNGQCPVLGQEILD